jgi:hypothetical protein
MLKKIMLLAMAVGALVAFAAPAMAQAETVITDTEGEPATTITAFSSNSALMTVWGITDCNAVNLAGHVTNGSPATLSEIQGTATSDVHPFSTTGECPLRNGEGVPITGLRFTAISGHAELEGGSGTVSFDFTYDLTVAPGVFLSGCTFTTEGAALTYDEAGSIALEFVLTGGGPAGCPLAGGLSGDLALDGTIDG